MKTRSLTLRSQCKILEKNNDEYLQKIRQDLLYKIPSNYIQWRFLSAALALALEGHRKNDKKSWKLPSGKDFRVIGKIIDNNNYLVLEVSDWVPVSADVLKKPVKFKKGISTARPFV